MPHYADTDPIELKLTILPSGARLLALHRDELPQKDDLCGPFWVLLALRAADPMSSADGIDQDAVARASGTRVSAEVDEHNLPAGHPGRRDYRLTLPLIGDSGHSGTSTGGLMRAVDELSESRMQAIPLVSDWSAERVSTLFDLALRHATTVLLNVDTGELWGSDPSPALVLDHLAHGPAGERPPDWTVGHFVALVGLVSGAEREIALVADTYESIGWHGVHVQPLDRIARALSRHERRTGGALLVVGAEAANALGSEAEERGFEIAVWDNGSPDVGAG